VSSTNGHGPKRAILYARVSTEEQARSGYSLAQQIEALREYTAQGGYEILEEITDPGQSGSSLERPGLDHVRDLVAAGGVSIVLVQDRDRIAREPAFHVLLKLEFEEHGCKLRALNDRGGDSPEDQLTEGILDQLAKFERLKTAERTRRGRVRKAKEGRLIGTARALYGFKYNAARDGFVIHEPEMLVVERIFRLAAQGLGVKAIQSRLYKEGVLTQNGRRVWRRAVIQRMIRNDAYKPHSYHEVEELVSSEVTAQLDPNEKYGVEWCNREKVVVRTISEQDSNGGRLYRKRQIRKPRPKEEWVAVPVPAYLSRDLVDQARVTFEANKGSERTRLSREWELRGLMRCSCGSGMGTHTIKPKDRNRTYFYYHCYQRRMLGSMASCAQKALSASEVEEAVWRFVSSLLKKPEHIKQGMERMIALEREGAKGDPKREERIWAKKLAETDRKRSRYQHMAAEGLITFDELRAKLAELEDTRHAGQCELEGLRSRQERIEELERDRNALMESWAGMLPEALDGLVGAKRNQLYRLLRLEVRPTPEAGYEVEGAVCTSELPSKARCSAA
jgi:site-specific DNA recombinase